jgi:hypothetical protein
MPEVDTLLLIAVGIAVDRLCGLVAGVPNYRTEMYCVSCEVQTEFIYIV